jgi:hypothetical protein
MLKVYLGQSLMGYDQSTSPVLLALKKILLQVKQTVYDPLDFEVSKLSSDQLVALDLRYVRKSTHLVCDLTRPSLGGGSFGEIYEARRHHIPVFLICPDVAYGPWMRFATDGGYRWRSLTNPTEAQNSDLAADIYSELLRNYEENHLEGHGRTRVIPC